MARRKEEGLFEILAKAPWWFSAILAVISYVSLKFILPSMLLHSSDFVNQAVAKAAPTFAPIISILFVITGGLSLFRNFIERKKALKNNQYNNELLSRQRSLPDISALHWKEFEGIIGAAYKNMGYEVKEFGGSKPDGGIDLILLQNGHKAIVQCKHWEDYAVGVKVVRELYGIMAAEGADQGILITSSYFTREAENFAYGKPLQLIQGNELSRLIKRGQIVKSVPSHKI